MRNIETKFKNCAHFIKGPSQSENVQIYIFLSRQVNFLKY
jgi:hypothetical protein